MARLALSIYGTRAVTRIIALYWPFQFADGSTKGNADVQAERQIP
ncbi:hypothetical protein CES85_1191 [Ochrobactrum quorumnocens]|uniref:Uncharacterized protein n=1 Tax=Ochrobactrum quorumnocens TaxID=271865 RepID=A0A248UF90_9HYPH|nr:hypothetical protein CES85_1191 [[Ochrobactrum] quorumnocens]